MPDIGRAAPVRILIVDDHPVVISGCSAMLSAEIDCTILSAATMEAAESLASTERPDLCIVDLNLPVGSGFELCRRILAAEPSSRIVVFSMNDDPVFAARAIELGVLGYASKAGDPADLMAAVRDVLAGGVYLPTRIARSLAFARRTSGAHSRLSFTDRETEILSYLVRGYSLGEIASSMNIAYKTAANISSLIKKKTGARNLAELISFEMNRKPAM